MDIDYNELFGLTPEEDTGANEQEITEPADDTIDNDIETETEPKDDASEGSSAAGDEPETEEKPEQTADENAKYAAARRKAEKERDDAIAAERARSEAAIQDMLTKAGFVNPYTGQPVKTKAEFDAYITKRDEDAAKQAAEKRNRELRKAGLSQETIDSIVSEHPAVKQAREMAQQQQIRLQQERAAQAKAALDADVKLISELDPDVKTVEDVVKAENFKEILALTRRGYKLSDAYRLINADKIAERKFAERMTAAKQAEMNKKNSKDHLKATGKGKTGGDEPLSKETIERYRQLMPNATIEQIKAYEAKYNKNKKG